MKFLLNKRRMEHVEQKLRCDLAIRGYTSQAPRQIASDEIAIDENRTPNLSTEGKNNLALFKKRAFVGLADLFARRNQILKVNSSLRDIHDSEAPYARLDLLACLDYAVRNLLATQTF